MIRPFNFAGPAALAMFLTVAAASAQDTGMEASQPLPRNPAELTEQLRRAGLTLPAIMNLVAKARAAVILEPRPTDDDAIPLGASKIGGRPDLPTGMTWPMRPAYEGADKLAATYRKTAAEMYADGGLVAPWLSEAEGQALIAQRRKQKVDTLQSTRDLMRGAGVTPPSELDTMVQQTPPEIARQSAAASLAMADAITGEMPLSFVAQIDLATLSTEPGFDKDLPPQGRLLFFFDLMAFPATFEARARAGWRLIHDETPQAELHRPEVPKQLRNSPSNPLLTLNPARLEPRSVLTTAPTGDTAWQSLGIDGDDAERYQSWLYQIGSADIPGRSNHQLGGWPRTLQSGLESVAQLASNGIDAGSPEAYEGDKARTLLEKAGEWRLVLQIGRDDAANLSLGGAFFVMMREADLRERRFDRAWVIYQND